MGQGYGGTGPLSRRGSGGVTIRLHTSDGGSGNMDPDMNIREQTIRTRGMVVVTGLLLLAAAGCVNPATTGNTGLPRRRGGESVTVVRYHVAGCGVAKAGDYLAEPAAFDEFLASGVDSVPNAAGHFDAPLATVFHRGRVFTLVSPTNSPVKHYDLLVVEDGRILMTVPDGMCNLSFSVPDHPVESDREQAPTTRPDMGTHKKDGRDKHPVSGPPGALRFRDHSGLKLQPEEKFRRDQLDQQDKSHG